MVSAVQLHEPARRAGRIPCRIPPYKREAGGSNPPAPTRKDQVRPHADLNKTYPRESQREPPVHVPGCRRGLQGRGSILVVHQGAPCTDSRYHRQCRGCWRGVLSKGFGPDGRRRRYKVSGRTKQDVIEALKNKNEELDAGLSTSRSYTIKAAACDWLELGLPGRSERTGRYAGMRHRRSWPRSSGGRSGT